MWVGSDEPREDADKEARGEQLHMAWFYTKFALFCWVFAIGGLCFQLDEYNGRIGFDTIMPALLFGIPAAITTVVAAVSFRQWHRLRHGRNPYDGLIGVNGKDVAGAVNAASLKMPHYDQDNDPDHQKIRSILFDPAMDATVRFPVFIPVDLWRRCIKPVEPDVGRSTTPENERLHTAYVVLHVANGRASVIDVDPISTFEQRAEFEEKGAAGCVSGGRYDRDAKAIIIGRASNRNDALLDAR